MASQFSTGSSGIQGVRIQGYTERASTSNSVRLTGYILRGVAVVLTFIAAIVMGTAKETVTVTDGVTSLTGTVKSTYSSAYIYFIVINVLAFLYSSVLLAISIVKRANLSNLTLPFAFADLVTGVLLFSCNSAAAAISVVAEQGQNELGWQKICDMAGSFCAGVVASIVLSMFASVAYLLLILLAIVGLHRSQ